MKLRIFSSVFLLALTAPAIAAVNVPEATILSKPKNIYIGVFGGYGSSNTLNINQLGTVFFIEGVGGPLAINAFGQSSSQSAGFYGLQLGYQAPGIFLNSSSQWTLAPGAELEGYSMNNSTFSTLLVNNSVRVEEHDFQASYPMSRNIFLANAILNFNHPSLLVHPYIGFGLGNAIIRISGANSQQINPAEVNVNHYNSDSSATTTSFAGQLKLGLSFDINNYFSLFADYRWLYIASSEFVFGSTVYPSHAETSPWQVNIDTQRYNLGNVGIRARF